MSKRDPLADRIAAERRRRTREMQSRVARELRASSQRQQPGRWQRPTHLFDLEMRRAKAAALAKTIERRTFALPDRFEMRERQDGLLRFYGYASLTECDYDVGFYTETVKRGAFKRTLSENPDVSLLLDHGDAGSGLQIARTTAGNLWLEEDDKGLLVKAELDPDDPDVELLARKMQRKLLDGQMSFAFQATDDTWSDDYTRRTLRAVSIHRGDVSIVTQGANAGTVAVLRSRAGATSAISPGYTSVEVRAVRDRQLLRATRMRKGS